MSSSSSEWARLFRIACSLIDQANSEQTIIDKWTFGGGTAMMIQIDHRESHDVDIFLPDSQLLRFLDPQFHDFKFEIMPAEYGGDGTGFLKLAFAEIGEIDFIVGQSLTEQPTVTRIVEGQTTLLETIPEIITKKIYHRGQSIKPRDIFDIAAARQHDEDGIVRALRTYKKETNAALEVMAKLNPSFVRDAVSDLSIKPSYRPISNTALESATELLKSI